MRVHVDAEGLRGLSALHDIEPGELLLSIPESASIALGPASATAPVRGRVKGRDAVRSSRAHINPHPRPLNPHTTGAGHLAPTGDSQFPPPALQALHRHSPRAGDTDLRRDHSAHPASRVARPSPQAGARESRLHTLNTLRSVCPCLPLGMIGTARNS